MVFKSSDGAVPTGFGILLLVDLDLLVSAMAGDAASCVCAANVVLNKSKHPQDTAEARGETSCSGVRARTATTARNNGDTQRQPEAADASEKAHTQNMVVTTHRPEFLQLLWQHAPTVNECMHSMTPALFAQRNHRSLAWPTPQRKVEHAVGFAQSEALQVQA